ncbi:hypothetical protein [Pseudoduganella buxea]|uniref:DUF4142 domain-containing protein n=1 Tax=Pseudoduganella buxea TaxID=1949069 RepID=A0A6I3SSA5_9BURK|nr:hypothetical protein [Pseudoduganella buxea]MTV51252.1 hypothetical protein [Pseudoduganella buxea]GGB96923.1 hypothetical protein GCM10011572_18600 [Pseudoduganella buxea]
MNLAPLFAAAGLALCMTCSGAALAAADPSRFLLTPELMTKMKAMEPEAAEAVEREGEGKGMNVKTAEDLQRQIDGTPALRQLVARHGLTSEEYAMAMFAALHAGMHVGFESAMGKKGAADAMAGYTQEQRANVDLIRKLYPPAQH